MDDLNIFTRTEAHLSKAVSTIKTFTDDISMEFGLDKCAIAVMKDGKQIKNQNIITRKEMLVGCTLRGAMG